MTDDFCIFCKENAHYSPGRDSRDHCTTCPAGHHYCLSHDSYTNILGKNRIYFKEHKIDLAQYNSYVNANAESPSDHMLIIGRDFHINYS